jgi:HK97 family phage portal protein
MGIFSFKKEKRYVDFPGNLQALINFFTSLNSKKTSSGEPVDQESALTFSAVWACVRILSETIASLPFHIYKYDNQGNKNIDPGHPLYTLIHDSPSPLMTSFIFRETLMAHLCLWGNAYAVILRNGAYKPVELQIIHPDRVAPVLRSDGKIEYEIKNVERKIPATDMIHIPGLSFDGITGKSPIDVAAENIGLGLALQKFGAEFFKNGATFSGTLEHPGSLSDTAYKHLKESLKKEHTGDGNRWKMQILEEGMKYTQVGVPPEAAQFILSRKFQLNEIARIFRIPPHMLADLERSSFSNIEQQSIDFVQHTVLPWCIRFEQEFNRKIFKESEKGKVFVKLNLMGLLRGDAISRSQYYATMFNIGCYSQNEIRALEDANSIGEDGDKYYVQLNMATGPKDENNGKSKDNLTV